VPEHSGAALAPPRGARAPLGDASLIQVQAQAVGAVCGLLNAAQLRCVQRSVDQACLIPRGIGWNRKAVAHAEIFGLLADAARDPVLIQLLNSGVGLAYHLMVMAGPVADVMTANSRKRLIGFFAAGDSDAAAREMEAHLRVLRFLGRLRRV
jgi:DNA-binding FadR family transcriptional regulator